MAGFQAEEKQAVDKRLFAWSAGLFQKVINIPWKVLKKSYPSQLTGKTASLV